MGHILDHMQALSNSPGPQALSHGLGIQGLPHISHATSFHLGISKVLNMCALHPEASSTENLLRDQLINSLYFLSWPFLVPLPFLGNQGAVSQGHSTGLLGGLAAGCPRGRWSCAGGLGRQ